MEISSPAPSPRRNLPTHNCHTWEAAISRVQPMNRLITEKANREAFLPIASMRKTALRDPNKAPMHRRLLIQVAWSKVIVKVVLLLTRKGMVGELNPIHIP